MSLIKIRAFPNRMRKKGVWFSTGREARYEQGRGVKDEMKCACVGDREHFVYRMRLDGRNMTNKREGRERREIEREEKRRQEKGKREECQHL